MLLQETRDTSAASTGIARALVRGGPPKQGEIATAFESALFAVRCAQQAET